MRERNEFILADLIALRAEQKPDLDVLTFEHHSLDGGATPDEVRTYAQLAIHANRIAAYNDVALVGDNNSGQLFRFPLNASRNAFDFSAFPALQDLVADDNNERDLLSIGSGFGVVTDLEIGPDRALYVVSLSGGSITRITGPGQLKRPALGNAGILLLGALLVLAPWVARRSRA